MDEQRARTVLARLADRPVLLWRGASVGGSDIDLVVLPGGAAEVAATLRSEGLERRGRLWSSSDGAVVVDPLPAARWPRAYPDLAEVLERASHPNGLPAVASAEDRLLIYAADAVGGRPLEKLLAKAAPLLRERGAEDRLRELARRTGDLALAELIVRPPRARRGRMPYGAAAMVALRSPRARRALAARARERLVERAVTPRLRRRRGLLISVSGMDGAGKSSATEAIERHLRAAGVDAAIAWYRIGEEAEQLNRIALPVKRLLRRSVTIADPIASRSPTETVKRQDPRVAQGRLGPVAWTWILIVVAIGVRSYRRTCRLAQAGAAVVCDRWACDSLVDLEVRYGRHRAAAWLLRAAVPRPDVAFLLSIDAETAARRKPGDQALSVLQRMQSLYERAGAELGLTRVDATRPHDAVLADVVARVDALLSEAAR